MCSAYQSSIVLDDFTRANLNIRDVYNALFQLRSFYQQINIFLIIHSLFSPRLSIVHLCTFVLAGSLVIVNIHLLFQVSSTFSHLLSLHWSWVLVWFLLSVLSLSVTIQCLFTLLLLIINCILFFVPSLLSQGQMF